MSSNKIASYEIRYDKRTEGERRVSDSSSAYSGRVAVPDWGDVD
jgi:hypothetical protein